MPLLHVRPTRGGGWIVIDPELEEPISEHPDAASALRAAKHHNARRGGGDVLVHDLYDQIHQYRARPASAPSEEER